MEQFNVDKLKGMSRDDVRQVLLLVAASPNLPRLSHTEMVADLMLTLEREFDALSPAVRMTLFTTAAMLARKLIDDAETAEEAALLIARLKQRKG